MRLVRDVRNPGRFVSFGQWDDADAVRGFKSEPEFKQRLGGVVRHAREFEPTDLVTLAKVTGGTGRDTLAARRDRADSRAGLSHSVTAQTWPQPMVVVRDVLASSRFYQHVLGAESGHGGDEYERILSDGEIVLQLHRIDVEDHHRPLADPDQPLGNGVLLWFEVADFDATVERVRATGAPVVRDVHTNPNARQQEIWVRDPDGYLVVLAGPSEYRPRR